jgi:predicted Fe-Mo cluster-binding NifX family protein
MKIGIPTNGSKGLTEDISNHFGHATTYTIVDVESNNVEIIPINSQHAEGSCSPPEILSDKKVEILLCNGLGKRALDNMNSLGISVFIGAQGTVQDALNLYKEGKLQQATDQNACSHHEHQHGHHCH